LIYYFCSKGKIRYNSVICENGCNTETLQCNPSSTPTDICSDSDSAGTEGELGWAPKVKGTATLGETSKTDSCKDTNILFEKGCSGDKKAIREFEFDCRNIAGGKHICINGRCVLDSSTPAQTCSDSDATSSDPGINGWNPGTKGSVSAVLDSGESVSATDFCVDRTHLAEIACVDKSVSGNLFLQTNYNCKDMGKDYICYNGRCLQMTTPATTDRCSGSAWNPKVKGTSFSKINGVTNSIYDFCLDNKMLAEIACVDPTQNVGNLLVEKYNCENIGDGRYVCRDGQCVLP
jgi:hypothetical protein